MSKPVFEKLARAIMCNVGSLTEIERDSLMALIDGSVSQHQFFLPNFTVPVNYDHTVEELIKAGNFEWTGEGITSSNFPSNEFGQKEVTIFLFIFDFDIRSENVIKIMDNQGFRPANLKELLSLGTRYSDFKSKDWVVVALGSTWRDSNDSVSVPYIRGPLDKCTLHLIDWGGGWGTLWQFAAVRK